MRQHPGLRDGRLGGEESSVQPGVPARARRRLEMTERSDGKVRPSRHVTQAQACERRRACRVVTIDPQVPQGAGQRRGVVVDDVQRREQRRRDGPLAGLRRLVEIPMSPLEAAVPGDPLELGGTPRTKTQPQARPPLGHDIPGAILTRVIFSRDMETEIRERYVPQGDQRRRRISRDRLIAGRIAGVGPEIDRDLLSETHGDLDAVAWQEHRRLDGTRDPFALAPLHAPGGLREDPRQALRLDLLRGIEERVDFPRQETAAGHALGLAVGDLDPKP